jgi:hypothetical protein
MVSVTADGLAGKVGEWIVISRFLERKNNRAIIVYAKLVDNVYKVQVFDKNGEIWKEFYKKEDVIKFIRTLGESFFYRGRIYKNNEISRLSLEPFDPKGNIRKNSRKKGWLKKI